MHRKQRLADHIRYATYAAVNRRPIQMMALVIVMFCGTANADLDGGEFRSDKWNVRLSAPKGWQVSEHSSYPGILLWVVHHRPDARMLFSAETFATKARSINAQSYAIDTAKRLRKLGYQVRAPQLHSATGAFWIDFDDGKHFLRQALLVPDDVASGYTLTLSAPDANTRTQFLRVFDYTLRSIKINRINAANSRSSE